MELELKIDGMHCNACVRRVTQALEKTPGVTVDSVTIGSALVEAEDSQAVIAALQKAGYTAQVAP